MERAGTAPERTPVPGQAPSGLVTFLFSDIEGSTTRWDRDPAAMQAAVRLHDALMRSAIAAHRGHVFKTIGDAFCASFWNAADGIAAALEAQRALGAADFSAVEGVRVRMALHLGASDERDGDYFGPPVNRVARLLATGYGGQVLLSSAVAEAARAGLPPGLELRDLGEHRLKDLRAPERVFQLLAPELRGDFPPLRSLSVLENNLPQQLTSLVGRDDVLRDVVAALGEARLVTLTGAGGVGKTRVALAAGAELLESIRDGVWFVDLAPLRDAGLVAAEVAKTLGLQQSPERPIRETLVQYLSKRAPLIVMDNCEHVIAEATQLVGAILHACPEVRILATSREALNVGGERVFRMPSLAFPPAGSEPDAAEALGYGAIALFVERARAIAPGFELDDAAAPIVADICRRLDGIALAIELAAARVNVLSVPQLAQRLNERFRLLTGGRRSALPRQQTMRALIDWSFELLTESERALLRQFAVFSAGATLEAVQAVVDEAIDEFEVIDLLGSLVEKSLLVADVGNESARYRLLESTHAYAREKLDASAEGPALARRHAAWVAEFAERAAAERYTTPRQRWLPGVEVEVDNARAALAWSLRTPGAVEFAARIAGGLSGLWNQGGLRGEGLRWVESILANLDEGTPPSVAAPLWLTLANLTVGKRTVESAERAVALFREAHDGRGLAGSHRTLALGLLQTGRLQEAEAAIDSALAQYRAASAEATPFYANALEVRAAILSAAGREGESQALSERALALRRTLGDERGAAMTQLNLADSLFAQGSGDARRALDIARDACQTLHGLSDSLTEANALSNCAAYHFALGEIDEARTAARQALVLSRLLHATIVFNFAIQSLAMIAAHRGDARCAALLLGYSGAFHDTRGHRRDPSEQWSYETALTAIRERLDETTLDAALAEGAALPEDRIASLALEV